MRPSCRYEASAAKLPPVEEFDPTTAFTDFGGDLRRFAWREMAAARQPSDHCDITLRRREALAAVGDSDFATAMATALSRRAHQPIVRGQLQLYWLLAEIVALQDPGHAELWLHLSRGFEIMPEDQAAAHPQQHGENYGSCSDHSEAFNSELQRAEEEGFIGLYSTVAKKYGLPPEPAVTLSLGVVEKFVDTGGGGTEVKHRLVSDGSSNASHGTDRFTGSLNEAVPSTPPTLAGIEVSLRAASPHGYAFVVDERDAYMWCLTARHCLQLVTFMWRGRRFTWLSMCFGLKNAPWVQQGFSCLLCAATRRRIVAAGLRCALVADSSQKTPFHRPFNDSSQMLARARREETQAHVDVALAGGKARPAASLAKLRRRAKALSAAERRVTRSADAVDSLSSFLDDFISLATTRRASWYAFLSLLWCLRASGAPANMKAHKTRSPAGEQGVLGLELILHKSFHVQLSELRVSTLLAQAETMLQRQRVAVRDLMSFTGVLIWACVVLNARPFYRALLNILNRHGYSLNGKYRKPAHGKLLSLSDEEFRDIRMWVFILQHLNGGPVARGIRKNFCEHEATSDACCRPVGSAWGWEWAGLFDCGEFPLAWAPHIDARNKPMWEIFVGLLEAIGCLRMLRVALPRAGVAGKVLRLRVDNRGLMFQLRKLSSADPHMQPILREVFFLLMIYSVELIVEFIPSKQNRMSDLLSRRTHPDFSGKDRDELQGYMRSATALADVEQRRGTFADATPRRPDLLPMLAASRAQVAAPDATWVPQDNTQLDAILREWCVFGDRKA